MVISGLIIIFAGPVSCKISDLLWCNQDLCSSGMLCSVTSQKSKDPQLVNCQYLIFTGCIILLGWHVTIQLAVCDPTVMMS